MKVTLLFVVLCIILSLTYAQQNNSTPNNNTVTTCQVSTWNEWSACDQHNEQHRNRTIISVPAGHEAECPSLTETQPCTNTSRTENVDCQVTAWGNWSKCIQHTRSHERQVIVARKGEGAICPPLAESEECYIKIDCVVSEWGAWSKCDDSQQTHTRTIIREADGDGQPCPNLSETQDCNMPIDCVVSGWGEWSKCDGTRTHKRRIVKEPKYGGEKCPSLEESELCNTDCEVSDWIDWSPCRNSTQIRRRQIIQPPLGPDPKPCPDLEQHRSCELTCEVSSWSDWTTCDHGRQVRTRVITQNPQGAVKPCPELTEERECSEDCKLSAWGSWSNCTNGTQVRYREVIIANQGAGRPCANLVESRNCGFSCELSTWSEWSNCSEGVNKQHRTRHVLYAAHGGGRECEYLYEEKSCPAVPPIATTIPTTTACPCRVQSCTCVVHPCECMPSNCACGNSLNSNHNGFLSTGVPAMHMNSDATISHAPVATQVPTPASTPVTSSSASVSLASASSASASALVQSNPTTKTMNVHVISTNSASASITSSPNGISSITPRSVEPVVHGDNEAKPAQLGTVYPTCDCQNPSHLQIPHCADVCGVKKNPLSNTNNAAWLTSGSERPSNQSIRTVLPVVNGEKPTVSTNDKACDCNQPTSHSPCATTCQSNSITTSNPNHIMTVSTSLHLVRPDESLPVIPVEDLPNNIKPSRHNRRDRLMKQQFTKIPACQISKIKGESNQDYVRKWRKCYQEWFANHPTSQQPEKYSIFRSNQPENNNNNQQSPAPAAPATKPQSLPQYRIKLAPVPDMSLKDLDILGQDLNELSELTNRVIQQRKPVADEALGLTAPGSADQAQAQSSRISASDIYLGIPAGILDPVTGYRVKTEKEKQYQASL